MGEPMPSVLYIGDYAESERAALAARGVLVAVWENGALRGRRPTESVVMRGPRSSPPAYESLCSELLRAGVTPRTPPLSYATLADSGAYGAALPGMVPDKVVLSRSAEAIQDLRALKHWGRAFLRSELGSAAKAKGTEACMLSTFEETEIAARLETLWSAHPAATQVVASKVEAIRTVDGANAEGRFIVIGGSLGYLDHCELLSDGAIETFERENLDRARAAIDALNKAGVVGDYFLDIAETAAGGWFVVEIKPLLNGTIRKLEQFAVALERNALE